MGKVVLYVMLSSIFVFAHNILGSRVYSVNQEKLDRASLGDDVDGLTSPNVDPFLYMIMNRSDAVQRSNDTDGGGAVPLFVAAQIMDSQSFYGIEVTSDMYGFSIDQDEKSGVIVQINNRGYNPFSIVNGIVVGWHVDPRLYGDSKTHFFVYWTRDSYRTTGCYNLKCPGYVPEDNVTFPGVTIDSVSDPDGVKRTIIFKVFKESTTGDWLLHLGFDSEPYLIGRFPKTLFTTLSDKANEIRLYGFVETHTTHLAPMGSGFLSNNKKAASLSNIQLIDQNGQASKVTEHTPYYTYMMDQAKYSVSPISPEGTFTYGGPLE
ncbi:hypothetical protein ACP70R_045825 [Stipagrostis hirtigluma subsp. patula]